MAGGLLQLATAYGQQNIYLNSNPQITHFKRVYKTHTNFSMESIAVQFNRTNVNVYEYTLLKAKIDRNADLVGQIYFSFDIPDIVSDNANRFRWIENFAEAMIEEVYITIGGNRIDQQNGEYIHIMNQLTYGVDKRDVYNRMIGNTIEYTNPEQYYLAQNYLAQVPLQYRVGNEYPISNDPSRPSIRARRIHLPLTFWFNLDLSAALPLISLQFSEVEIVFNIRPISHLYKLWYKRDGALGFYAPDLTNPKHLLHNFVFNANRRYMTTTSTLDIRASLEVNYVYLDQTERMYFAYKPIEYLIQQVRIIPKTSLADTNVLELVLSNPVKEIIWVCKRNDISIWNSWLDYTDRQRNIMTSARVLFNGMERLTEKPWEYFNYVQPFQHHKGCGKNGIFVYSFSITPEDHIQPSGSCNMSRVNKIHVGLNLIPPTSKNYGYDAYFYVTNYNILRISNGLAGTVYVL
jgi:hypothetical protein